MSAPEITPSAMRDNVMSLRYLLLGFVLSWLPLPISGLAVVPLLLSLGYGIRYVLGLRRSGLNRLVGPNVFGLVLTAGLLVMVATPIVHYERSMSYQECMWGANTGQAKDACQAEFGENRGALQQLLFG